MTEVGKLPNIGKQLAIELEAVGIHTDEDLKRTGSLGAIMLVNGNTFDEGCLSKLYAFEGALQGIRWHGLSKEVRASLKDSYYQELGK